MVHDIARTEGLHLDEAGYHLDLVVRQPLQQLLSLQRLRRHAAGQRNAPEQAFLAPFQRFVGVGEFQFALAISADDRRGVGDVEVTDEQHPAGRVEARREPVQHLERREVDLADVLAVEHDELRLLDVVENPPHHRIDRREVQIALELVDRDRLAEHTKLLVLVGRAHPA